MEIRGEIRVDAPRETAFEFVRTPELLAACMPGCRDLTALDDGRYAANMEVKVGFVPLKFRGTVSLDEVVPPERLSGTVVAKPTGMPGQLQTAAHLALDAIDAHTTRMQYLLDIGITGKLGSIGQSAFRAKAEELAGVFGSNVKSAIEEREHMAGAA
jgi:carbon monoxide dehydrogenase subunit G